MTDEEAYERYWKQGMIELAIAFDKNALDVLSDNSIGAEVNQELWID